MSDIFISYSRKDSERALELAERLRARGVDVWIDTSGIEAAKSWSKEIVRAIDECKAFLVLISQASQESVNVSREVGIASESKKPMLPVALEDIKLSDELRYHLSGIQRVAYTQFDAITQALESFGITRETVVVDRVGRASPPDSPDARKTLMILPFEDLSPTGDNQWFADGIVSEMISALSNVKALRISDNQATKEFKSFKGQLTTYAREMDIRYFVQGDVRKFGDNINITSRLLDIETGDHLWQDSMKGTMEDIFDIQEKVAEKVVEGLKVHLAADEKNKLAERGTENSEAYELYMKAREYFSRGTMEGYRLSTQLFAEAIRLDPNFAEACRFKAVGLTALYRNYKLDPALLDEAEALCKEALRLKPDLFAVGSPLSHIYTLRGMHTEAEEVAKEFVAKDPQNYHSHFTLGYFYGSIGQPAKSITPYEEAVRLKPDDLTILRNLASNCAAAGEMEKCEKWARVALPAYERYLKLHPDDEGRHVSHANLLLMSGRADDAHAAAVKLTNLKDGNSLYNTACLFGKLGERAEALATFRKAIEAGFRNTRHLKEFLTEITEGIVSLVGTQEYEEVKRMVEEIEQEANANA